MNCHPKSIGMRQHKIDKEKNSVVNPSTLNLYPDHKCWPNLDPELSYHFWEKIVKKLFYRNTGTHFVKKLFFLNYRKNETETIFCKFCFLSGNFFLSYLTPFVSNLAYLF